LLENYQREPKLRTLLKLAGGLGIEPGELLNGMAWRPGRINRGKYRLAEIENS
jgi:hypothetical protein